MPQNEPSYYDTKNTKIEGKAKVEGKIKFIDPMGYNS